MNAESVRAALRGEADVTRGRNLARFFKCGPGEYGEGDVFLGVTVPVQRTLARRFRDLTVPDADQPLQSCIHEERLTALLVLVDQFQRREDRRGPIFRRYIRRLRAIERMPAKRRAYGMTRRAAEGEFLARRR